MKSTICRICDNQAHYIFTKPPAEYYQCTNCRTVFCDPLDNDNMIGGGAEIERNATQNQGRIDRLSNMLGGYKNQSRVLDFGCGHGMLVNDLRAAGFQADGYDLYNPEFNEKLPERNTYNVITCVEVIEHTSAPFYELDVMFRALMHGGGVYIETGFVDVAEQEEIPLEEFYYINPIAGHATIFSHHGLDVLMISKGFKIMQHYNRNVRIYRKP